MNAPYDWRRVITEGSTRYQIQGRVLKQDRSRQRSSEILAAAVRVFARRGIARARVAEIAAEAGVPLPSLYDYFKGKAELACAVPIARQTEFYEEFLKQADALQTCRERLAHYLWLTADFARRDPDWARVLYLEIWPSVLIKEARVRVVLDDYARIVIALIQEGSAAGEWPEDPDPFQTAAILIGSVSQVIITWSLYRRPRDLDNAIRALVARIMTLLDTRVQPRARQRLPAGSKKTRVPAKPAIRKGKAAKTASQAASRSHV